MHVNIPDLMKIADNVLEKNYKDTGEMTERELALCKAVFWAIQQACGIMREEIKQKKGY